MEKINIRTDGCQYFNAQLSVQQNWHASRRTCSEKPLVEQHPKEQRPKPPRWAMAELGDELCCWT